VSGQITASGSKNNKQNTFPYDVALAAVESLPRRFRRSYLEDKPERKSPISPLHSEQSLYRAVCEADHLHPVQYVGWLAHVNE